jgi:hypothetical protein
MVQIDHTAQSVICAKDPCTRRGVRPAGRWREQVVIYGTQGDDGGKFIGFVATAEGDGAAQRAG